MKKILIFLPLLVLMAACQKDWDEQNVKVATDHALLAPGETFQINVLSEGDATFSAWEGDSLTCTTLSGSGLVTAKAEVAARDTDFVKVSIKGLRSKNVVVIVDPAAVSE